ncbi:hypothetical protein D3C78_1062180 [compost metagenome]
MNNRLIKALWKVRAGDADPHQEGINFGIALGMATAYPYDEHCRISDLVLNAAKYARMEKAERRQAA